MEFTKILWAVGGGIVIWLFKTIANANDPDRQVKKDLLRLFTRKRKLLKKKDKLDEAIKKEKNTVKRITIGNNITNIVIELSRLRIELEKLAYWK